MTATSVRVPLSAERRAAKPLFPPHVWKLQALVSGTAVMLGVTGILVTHDVPCALAVGDRIAFLSEGKIATVQERSEIDRNADKHISAYINGDIA